MNENYEEINKILKDIDEHTMHYHSVLVNGLNDLMKITENPENFVPFLQDYVENLKEFNFNFNYGKETQKLRESKNTLLEIIKYGDKNKNAS